MELIVRLSNGDSVHLGGHIIDLSVNDGAITAMEIDKDGTGEIVGIFAAGSFLFACIDKREASQCS